MKTESKWRPIVLRLLGELHAPKAREWLKRHASVVVPDTKKLRWGFRERSPFEKHMAIAPTSYLYGEAHNTLAALLRRMRTVQTSVSEKFFQGGNQ